MPAKRKVTSQQMELLVSFMEEHKALARGQPLDTPQARAAVKQQCEELAATLNAMRGTKKTGSQWRDYWRDTKYRVKKKVGELEEHKRGSGGGPPSTEMLTPMEEKIYAIFRRWSVSGDDELQPSTSHAPSIKGPSSAPCKQISPATSKRKHGADATVEARTPSAGDSPAASKRSRIADDAAAANPTEIPRSTEQNLLALEQRRLDVQEAMLAEMRKVTSLFKRSVAAHESTATTLREMNENIATIIEHLDQQL